MHHLETLFLIFIVGLFLIFTVNIASKHTAVKRGIETIVLDKLNGDL